jgi:hypothetical protein
MGVRLREIFCAGAPKCRLVGFMGGGGRVEMLLELYVRDGS